MRLALAHHDVRAHLARRLAIAPSATGSVTTATSSAPFRMRARRQIGQVGDAAEDVGILHDDAGSSRRRSPSISASTSVSAVSVRRGGHADRRR